MMTKPLLITVESVSVPLTDIKEVAWKGTTLGCQDHSLLPSGQKPSRLLVWFICNLINDQMVIAGLPAKAAC